MYTEGRGAKTAEMRQDHGEECFLQVFKAKSLYTIFASDKGEAFPFFAKIERATMASRRQTKTLGVDGGKFAMLACLRSFVPPPPLAFCLYLNLESTRSPL